MYDVGIQYRFTSSATTTETLQVYTSIFYNQKSQLNTGTNINRHGINLDYNFCNVVFATLSINDISIVHNKTHML